VGPAVLCSLTLLLSHPAGTAVAEIISLIHNTHAITAQLALLKTVHVAVTTTACDCSIIGVAAICASSVCVMFSGRNEIAV
jgi:hypothetical protein